MGTSDFEGNFTNPEYLLKQQYPDSANLSARVQIHQRFSTNPYGWYPWLFDQLDLPPDASILELGCGPGSFWPGRADRIPSGWIIFLSDFSAGMVMDARRALDGKPAFTCFNVGDAQSIPYPAETFDTVIANHMLYHIPDLPKALAEIHRVLKPGGRLFAATNGQGHMQEIYSLARRFDHHLLLGAVYLPFNLENGTGLLTPWFSDVTTQIYPDSLRVTEAGPLLAYILSMTTKAGANMPLLQAAAFTDFLSAEIKAHGAIHITKSAGLLIARKG